MIYWTIFCSIYDTNLIIGLLMPPINDPLN